MIGDATETLARLPEHRAERDRLKDLADPSTEDETSLRLVTDLIRDGESLESGKLLALLGRRFTPATAEDGSDLWKRTRDEIGTTPIYGGSTLPKAQFGLWPLGQDPKSGLFEFAHLFSGSLPTRNPATGRFEPDDAAIVFVLVPGGTFWMGAQYSDAAKSNHDPLADPEESPVHQVTLSPFFIAKYECTQAQWERLTGGERPSYFSSDVMREDLSPRNPVERVSWDDCGGKPGWLVRYGLKLPTESQWEYACRAPLSRDLTPVKYLPWSSGADEKALLDAAWLRDNSEDGHTWPVGMLDPNRFGLHDTHGNVWEWCEDTWTDSYEGAPDDGSAWVDQGPDSRVIRGGCWSNIAEHARSTFRAWRVPGDRTRYVGFRPARSVTP